MIQLMPAVDGFINRFSLDDLYKCHFIRPFFFYVVGLVITFGRSIQMQINGKGFRQIYDLAKRDIRRNKLIQNARMLLKSV